MLTDLLFRTRLCVLNTFRSAVPYKVDCLLVRPSFGLQWNPLLKALFREIIVIVCCRTYHIGGRLNVKDSGFVSISGCGIAGKKQKMARYCEK